MVKALSGDRAAEHAATKLAAAWRARKAKANTKQRVTKDAAKNAALAFAANHFDRLEDACKDYGADYDMASHQVKGKTQFVYICMIA